VSHRRKGILRAVDPSPSLVVIEESPYYFLTQDEDGFSLWSVVGDDADEPVLSFPAGDDGLERARAAFRRETRYGRWSKVLLVGAIVAAPIWIMSVVVERWIELFVNHPFVGFQDALQPDRLRLWFGLAGSVANTAFVIAVGLSLVIWLHRRYHREG
jgi:hypothetical protein